MQNKSILTMGCIGAIIIAVIVSACSLGGAATTWFKGTVGRTVDLVANEEDVRMKCQSHREDLERAYKDAQNVYTQEVVLTVQDLANVATLSNDQKIRVNESALKLIFQESTDAQGNQTQGINGFIGDIAKTGIQFDKTDDELYRQISRAIRDGRFKFNRKLEEFTLKEKIFKDYINKTRVKVLGNNEVLNMSNWKGCFNSVGDTEKYANADEYFKKFKMPTTEATDKAFSPTGFDAPVLGKPAPTK